MNPESKMNSSIYEVPMTRNRAQNGGSNQKLPLNPSFSPVKPMKGALTDSVENEDSNEIEDTSPIISGSEDEQNNISSNLDEISIDQ